MTDQLKRYLTSRFQATEQEIQTVCDRFRPVVFRKNERMLNNGDICRYAYFIEAGAARAVSTDETGNEATRYIALENECITSLNSFIGQKAFPMQLLQTIIENTFQHATLLQKEQVADHCYHLRIELAKPFRQYISGQQLRIVVGSGIGLNWSDLLRTYSVWHYDAGRRQVDLAVCTFSNGPGANWAKQLQPGDKLYFSGPTGKFIVDSSARHYLFFGDVCALSPFYEISRGQGEGKLIEMYVLVRDEGDYFQDLYSNREVKLVRYEREDYFAAIQPFLQGLSFDADDTIAYIAGPSGFCKTVYRYLFSERKMNRKRIYAKPFWQDGKKGMD